MQRQPVLRCTGVSLVLDGAHDPRRHRLDGRARRALGRARRERRGQDDAAAGRRALPASVVGHRRRARPDASAAPTCARSRTHRVLLPRARGPARTVDDRGRGRDDRALRRARAVVAPLHRRRSRPRARAARRVAVRRARRPRVPDAVGRRTPTRAARPHADERARHRAARRADGRASTSAAARSSSPISRRGRATRPARRWCS